MAEGPGLGSRGAQGPFTKVSERYSDTMLTSSVLFPQVSISGSGYLRWEDLEAGKCEGLHLEGLSSSCSDSPGELWPETPSQVTGWGVLEQATNNV